jgi:hypothetical protein
MGMGVGFGVGLGVGFGVGLSVGEGVGLGVGFFVRVLEFVEFLHSTPFFCFCFLRN